MSSPRIEDGVVVGTGSDKYQTKNPVARYAIKQLLQTVSDFSAKTQPSSILEIGCGEGHITEQLLHVTDASIHATDLSETLISEARDRLRYGDRLSFSKLNIYDLNPQELHASLVVCCEVLEHLDKPETGLALLAKSARDYAVLSVPREPNFRILNFLRGQHFAAWGNAPGHLQHWSKRAFIAFVETQFDIVATKGLLPWTVVLATPKRGV
ncbi:MAG: class I SAM-dependent methyltransferase [Halioglobus sp.]|nr:class I SAM-dependent methyltransferase [Halioglobus sp.]